MSAEFALDDHRLGVDAERVQDSEQQGGLRLAVSEAPRPCQFRLGRHVAALAHEQRDIADTVLHEGERLLGSHLRVVTRRPDPLDLIVQRAGCGDGRRIAEQRTEQIGEIGPGAEIGRFRQSADLEAQRRALGRHQRLNVLRLHFDRGRSAGRRFLHRRKIGRLPQLKVHVVRPAQRCVCCLDRQAVPGAEHRLDMALEHGIAVLRSGGQVDDVAHLQAFRLERCGQRAVEGRRIEIGLAPQDREGLSAGKNVDDLVAAADLQLVDGDGIRLRLPALGSHCRRRGPARSGI